MKKIFSIFLSCFLLSNTLQAQVRQQYSINDGWKYRQGGWAYAEMERFDDSKWETVSLPHTWNATDPFDDDKTYYRGISWYRKNWVIDSLRKDKNYYLVFEGGNQVADVFVNGAFCGRHIGGYTAFTADATPYLHRGTNLIAVQLNNAHDAYIAPLSIGYASYGGLYRDTWMVMTDKVHFTDVNTASRGVYITPQNVSATQATTVIKTHIRNDGNRQQTVRFVNMLLDSAGGKVAEGEQQITLQPKEEGTLTLTLPAIRNPQLWSPENPYLYQVISQLVIDGQVVDEVQNETGFRWFSFDANNGFNLNGKKYLLHGTNRHQDMLGKGDALSIADHERDLRLIKNMGCNFLRLAHYPQAPEVLRLADRIGLLLWEETPILNFITEAPEYLTNSQQMLREMIRQGYNHPAIIIWGFSNEILLYSKEGVRIQKHIDTAYLNALRTMEQQLRNTVQEEDPTRENTMAMHGSDDYYQFGLDTIPQLASYNIYNGWYSGKLEDFGADLDRYHQRRPNQPLFISEYGAEGEIQLASEQPVRMDYTGQYQQQFHESYLRQIRQRPWLCGTAIWNEIDFSQPNIGGPTPHRNQKGVITWDRKIKDTYYLYKAAWNPEPMVYIATRDWLLRSGEEGAVSTLKVYSNTSEVSLSVNGKKLTAQKPDDVHKCTWQTALVNGENTITATARVNGKTITDEVKVVYQSYPKNLSTSTFQGLSINVGSGAQYTSPSNEVWVADKPYTAGSFGYFSSVPQFFSRSEVIKNTTDVPLFYSYLDSLKSYRMDVPEGEYSVTLCFAENKYNTGGQRVFNVAINNQPVLKSFDPVMAAGFAQAIQKTFVVKVNGKEGINISFDALKGGAILNGLQVRRL